jgi:hypothetical protein
MKRGNTEIYIRRASRKNFSENNIETNDMLTMFLQQIEMVMTTPPTAVLGNPNFGVGLSTYLHTFSTTDADLKNQINDQIRTYCSLAGEFRYEVNVKFYKTGTSDSAVVDVLVENEYLVRIIVNGN